MSNLVFKHAGTIFMQLFHVDGIANLRSHFKTLIEAFYNKQFSYNNFHRNDEIDALILLHSVITLLHILQSDILFLLYIFTHSPLNYNMAYRNILLIDDDSDDQEIFVSAVEMVFDAVNCITFFNAKEALQQLVKRQIAADLIFLDLNMPVMSGQQFLAEFKKSDLEIPVIILSTTANTVMIQQIRELGATDFITKPDKFNDLVVKLKEILN